jgi:hypothetical protein
MSNRHLRLAAILCVMVCVGLLVQQAWFLLFAPTPAPLIARWAARYRVTSSIETGIIVAAGIGASVLLLARHTPIRGFAVGAFCLFVFWRQYFSHLGFYFRPVFGDGSLSAAASGWWRVHGPHIWVYSLSFVVLVTASIFAFYGSHLLRHRTSVA